MTARPAMSGINAPGIYTMTDSEYLADPVIAPSLNATVAKAIVGLSPRHGWAIHPRLGGAPDEARDSTAAQDFGTAVHQMFLHGESAIAVLNVPDFKTKRAQDLRDTALAEGRIPLKVDRYDAVMRVVNRLEEFRLRTGAFTQGKPEQTLIWQEHTQWGRCKVDWLPDEPEAYLWDLKTVSGRATPDTWSRSAFNFGYDIQASYYPRGCECVRGEPPAGMKFCVVETDAPYGVKVFEFTPAALEDADAEVADAIATWARCRESGVWPAYSDDTEWIDAPPWKLKDRAWRRQRRQDDLVRVPPENAAVIEQMIKTGNLGG